VTLEYEIEYSEPLISVRTWGVFEYLSAYEMWREIATACDTNDCYDVLGFSNLTQPLRQVDAYDQVELLESNGISPKHRVAWVAGREELLENLRLAEAVFRNRTSLNVRVFETVDDARKWLSERRAPSGVN
jgi:hypothetical protein